MNELARLVSFSFYLPDGGFPKKYRIVDRDGNPWFAAMDAGKILGIKSYRRTIATFPEDEKSYVVAAVYSIYGTCGVASNDATSVEKMTSHVPEEWKGRYPIPTPGGIQDMLCLSEKF
jgi:prophage antirepressor-like protein